MVDRNKILNALIGLGDFLGDFIEDPNPLKSNWHKKLADILNLAQLQNQWFTSKNLHHALEQWSLLLNRKRLDEWLTPYSFFAPQKSKTIAIIMAGNIPMVGFHDFLSVLVSGHRVLCKLSSNDKVVLPFMADFLINSYPALSSHIAFTQEKLGDFDAVIATGSNNTGRYFEYYFKDYPSIIRKNRNSVAVLKGEESSKELEALGEDIFRYFGLGCRSVSKLFVPEGYNFSTFFEAIFPWKHILDNHKYCNNYDYNKAVFLMSDFKIFDNNFLLLKEDVNNTSPIGALYFEYYSTVEALQKRITEDREQLQCVVAKGFMENEVLFGRTQKPRLQDYADDVDTLDFLLAI